MIKESKTSPKKIRFDPNEEIHSLDLQPINIVMGNIRGQEPSERKEFPMEAPPKKKPKKKSKSPEKRMVSINSKSPSKNNTINSAVKRSARKTISSKMSNFSGEYRGFGPLPQKKTGKKIPNNFFQFDDKYFKKMPGEPSLFNLDVDEKDVDHLLNDDVDEASRMEIIYKILKE